MNPGLPHCRQILYHLSQRIKHKPNQTKATKNYSRNFVKKHNRVIYLMFSTKSKKREYCLFVSVFWFVAPLPAASFLTTTEYTLILSSPWWRPLAFLFFLSSPHILDYFYPLLEDRAWISHFCSSSAYFRLWQVTQAEKVMAPHSSTLAWKIPWTEGPGGLQSMGSLEVRHDWVTSLSLFTFMHWKRK